MNDDLANIAGMVAVIGLISSEFINALYIATIEYGVHDTKYPTIFYFKIINFLKTI
jgi:hypothetical protein